MGNSGSMGGGSHGTGVHDPLATDPGAKVPGVGLQGDPCTCDVPAVNFKALHEQDKEYMRLVDIHTLKSLIKRKPEGERVFGESFDRLKTDKDRLDKVLAQLGDGYSELARRKYDLETAQQGVAYAHIRKCKPLQRAYGLHLPCHEEFREAMRTYRSLEELPGCTVGASLPLRPAAVAWVDCESAPTVIVGLAGAAVARLLGMQEVPTLPSNAAEQRCGGRSLAPGKIALGNRFL
mmetsp:Transcript_116585/g.324901  ORF Transcript_116585/g.324901 Transcript_116585/m.324901 type:complete len:235 (+) Transcript_116585:174-878(+)